MQDFDQFSLPAIVTKYSGDGKYHARKRWGEFNYSCYYTAADNLSPNQCHTHAAYKLRQKILKDRTKEFARLEKLDMKSVEVLRFVAQNLHAQPTIPAKLPDGKFVHTTLPLKYQEPQCRLLLKGTRRDRNGNRYYGFEACYLNRNTLPERFTFGAVDNMSWVTSFLKNRYKIKSELIESYDEPLRDFDRFFKYTRPEHNAEAMADRIARVLIDVPE